MKAAIFFGLVFMAMLMAFIYAITTGKFAVAWMVLASGGAVFLAFLLLGWIEHRLQRRRLIRMRRDADLQRDRAEAASHFALSSREPTDPRNGNGEMATKRARFLP